MISAFIPFNMDYFAREYSIEDNKNFDFANYMTSEIFPTLITKLSKINEISKIDFFTDLNFPNSILDRNPKVQSINSSGMSSLSIEQLLAEYMIIKPTKFLLVVNPMFPFVQSSTIQRIIEAVILEGYDSSALGKKGTSLWLNGMPVQKTNDTNTKSLRAQECVVDLGACYCLNTNYFNPNANRLSKKATFFDAGNIEGINLRDVNDLAVVDLFFSVGLGGGTF